jgi:RING finger protein 113A
VSDDEQQDEDGLPVQCPVCRGAFKEPVVTKCRHYFCESCALQQYRINPSCAVCHEPTSGLFMPAKEIVAKLKQQQMHLATASALPRASNDTDSDDDDKT